MGRFRKTKSAIVEAHEIWLLIKMGILHLTLQDIDNMPYDTIHYFMGFFEGEKEAVINGK